MCIPDKAGSERPSLTVPDTDMGEAMRTKSRVRTEEPRCTRLRADVTRPRQAWLLKDNDRSKWDASKTDKENTKPAQLKPTNSTTDSTCAWCRNESEESKFPKSDTRGAESNLEKLRAGGLKPRVIASTTDKVNTLPERKVPTIEGEKSHQAKLLTNNSKPRCSASNTEGGKPSHEEL